METKFRRIRGAVTSEKKEVNDLRERLRSAVKTWDEAALEKQRKAVQFAKTSALVVPLAVLLLTIQILAFPSPGLIAVILISVELLSLLFALFVLILRLGPQAGDWAHERLRAEILRREEYLLLARLGPYLKKNSPAELESVLDARLEQIENPMNSPDSFLPLRERRPWSEELEDAGPGRTAPPEPGFLDIFKKDRVRDQREWFWAKRNKYTKLNGRYENIIRATLALALVLSAMHLAILLLGRNPNGGEHSWLKLAVEIAAIVMPPVGSAAAAFQSLFQGRRLGRSYKLHALELDVIHRDLTALLETYREKTDALKRQPENEEGMRSLELEKDRFEFQLKRLALRTEELLTSELRVWYFVMRPGIQ